MLSVDVYGFQILLQIQRSTTKLNYDNYPSQRRSSSESGEEYPSGSLIYVSGLTDTLHSTLRMTAACWGRRNVSHYHRQSFSRLH